MGGGGGDIVSWGRGKERVGYKGFGTCGLGWGLGTMRDGRDWGMEAKPRFFPGKGRGEVGLKCSQKSCYSPLQA